MVPNTACSYAWPDVTNAMICAGWGWNANGQGSCSGDSGGPLTYKTEGGQHILIGDVSFGKKDCTENVYGVYGRISYFREWIEKKMRSPRFCWTGPNADLA